MMPMQQATTVPCSYIDQLCPGAWASHGRHMHRQGSRCFLKKHTLGEAGICVKGETRCGISHRARRTIGTYLSQAWSANAPPSANRTALNEPFILHSHTPYIYTLPWTWSAETAVC